MSRFKRIMTLKEHIVIWFFVIVILVVIFSIQYHLDGIKEEFWLSLIPSIIVDSLFILIGSYFITYLLQKNEEKRAKNKIYRMLGKRYETMVMELAKDYLTFITKKPCETKKDINNIEDVKEQVYNLNINIKNYVKSDFLSKNIEVLLFKPHTQSNNVFDMFQAKQCSVQHYTEYFKDKNSKNMDLFITKYISVIPDDLRERLFKIEDTLQSGILTTGSEVGLSIDISNAKFSPDEFAQNFKELGQDIYYLLTYFDESQEEYKDSKNFEGGLYHLITPENFILGLVSAMLIYILIDLAIT